MISFFSFLFSSAMIFTPFLGSRHSLFRSGRLRIYYTTKFFSRKQSFEIIFSFGKRLFCRDGSQIFCQSKMCLDFLKSKFLFNVFLYWVAISNDSWYNIRTTEMAMNPLPSNKHLVKSVFSGFALHPGFLNLILESPHFSANCVRFKSHITLFGISEKAKPKQWLLHN